MHESLEQTIMEAADTLYVSMEVEDAVKQCYLTLKALEDTNYFAEFSEFHRQMVRVGANSILWLSLNQECRHGKTFKNCKYCTRKVG